MKQADLALTLTLTSPRGCLQKRVINLSEICSTLRSVGFEGMLISRMGMERNRLSGDLPALLMANTKKTVLLSGWKFSLAVKLDAEVFTKVTNPSSDDNRMV